MQVDPVAMPLDLIDFALAVILAAGLEGEQLGVPRSVWPAVSMSRTVMRPA
jgi:hypothetical protein